MNSPVILKQLGLLAAILMAGCVPLQQAPLVYSSKVTVGIDVSAMANEQPEVSVNLGYKQVDIAYVPVAVAKPCGADKPTTTVDCAHATYALKKIEGRNSVGDSKTPPEVLQAAEKKISDFNQASAERDTAKKELKNATQKKQEIKSALDAQQSLYDSAYSKAPNKSVLAQSLAGKTLTTELNNLTEKSTLADATINLASAKKDRAEATLKNVNATDLAEAFDIVGRENIKHDAYSVFGSFDANTKIRAESGQAKTPAADVGLTIGKVFSTGVASQNLTEGIRTYYAGAGLAQVERARSECLSVGSELAAEFKKTLGEETTATNAKMEAQLSKIIEMCGKFPSDLLIKETKK